MPTFNVLIATINRPTLVRQLLSLVPQLNQDDCITIVFDGISEIPELSILKEFKCCVDIYCEPVELGFWGNGVRNKYASIMQPRDFVLHGDDDDIYSPTALELLRYNCVDKNTLYVAQMDDDRAGLIPRSHILCINNVGTPCGVLPWFINSDENIKWKLAYGGDGSFYESAGKVAKEVKFLDFIIYIVRPEVTNRTK